MLEPDTTEFSAANAACMHAHMHTVHLGPTNGYLAHRNGGLPGYDTPQPKPGAPVGGAGPTGLSAGSRVGVSPNLKNNIRDGSTNGT